MRLPSSVQSTVICSMLLACNDKAGNDDRWTSKNCPTPQFRAACEDLSEFSGDDRSLFEDACAASEPGEDCTADEQCVDATCLPLYANDDADCLAEQTPIDSDLADRVAAVAQESCSGESYGEGSSSAYVVRRGDGLLEAYYGTPGDAGTNAPCFPDELMGLEFIDADCALQPRTGWDDVTHNVAVSFPGISDPMYTGDTVEFTIGPERYIITIGTAEATVLYGPLVEGDTGPDTRIQVLVMREGYQPPYDAGR